MRLLKANEIDARIGTITDKGYTLLLYKDARVDMAILDETYGQSNWQRTHEVINGNLFCNIEVWDDEKKTWVKKQDVGTESFTEKEKGEASDSFKRAGVNWGIGRELYTSPFIWITPTNEEVETKDGKSKLKSGYKFKVDTIGYNDVFEINKLVISINKYGKSKVVYTMGTDKEDDNNLIKNQPIFQSQIEMIEHDLLTSKYTLEQILKKYNVNSLSALTWEQGEKIKKALQPKEVF
jgi:hypothetical protein